MNPRSETIELCFPVAARMRQDRELFAAFDAHVCNGGFEHWAGRCKADVGALHGLLLSMPPTAELLLVLESVRACQQLVRAWASGSGVRKLSGELFGADALYFARRDAFVAQFKTWMARRRVSA